jgi:AcrR family transcriptional regulator
MTESTPPAGTRKTPRTSPRRTSSVNTPAGQQPAQNINTRDLALETAEYLLQTQGYLGVSMETVAKGAGIRKASLYHHFAGGKTELMLELAERLIARDERGIHSAIGSSPHAVERLHAVADWMFSEQRFTERMLRDALRFMTEPDRRTLGEHFQRRLFGQIHAVLEAGVTNGEFRKHDTRFSTWVFLGLLSELGESQKHEAQEHLATRMLELLVNGLQPTAALNRPDSPPP